MKSHRISASLTLFTIPLIALILSGCDQSPIFYKYNVSEDGGTSVLIDAQQRAVVAAPGPADLDDKSAAREFVVCAEPSPDALSIVTSSLGAFGKGNLFGKTISEATVEAVFEKATQELGNRNATIQLLRDGLYRQCEAYLNGVITKAEYEKLANRYVDGMVTLLAIERITPNPEEGVASDSEELNDFTIAPNPDDSPGDSDDAKDGIVKQGNDTEVPQENGGDPAAVAETKSNEPPAGSDGSSATTPQPAAVDHASSRVEQRAIAIEKHVVKAVTHMTNVFLTKNLLDRCMDEHAEGESNKLEDIEEIKIGLMSSHAERIDATLAELRTYNSALLLRMERSDDRRVQRAAYRMIKDNNRIANDGHYSSYEMLLHLLGIRERETLSARLCRNIVNAFNLSTASKNERARSIGYINEEYDDYD